MGGLAERYVPAEAEAGARALWAARGLPRPDGVLGSPGAPLVHAMEGSFDRGSEPLGVVVRALAADVDARHLALTGRRVEGILRREGSVEGPVADWLRALSIWVGGRGSVDDAADRREGVQALLGRMGERGLVVRRDGSLRVCPECAAPRSPERIIYQEEEGDTYLVRFPLPEGDGSVQALAWVDAPWRLLGATALLVNPELPYVVARYRRRDVDERILTSRPSVARLLEWLPGAVVEVTDEGPGSRWAGRPYHYPLRHEFPMGGELVPPAGTLLAVPEVSDSGTGIVPLVPGHGGTDAFIAERAGVAGWPLVTPHGQLDFTLIHKYAGLDLASASEFVARDLAESGALFARLRVRRGVPHCAVCGTPLVWTQARAWCLEPTRLSDEHKELYRRLMPRTASIGQIEVAAWPVSESTTIRPGPGAVTLRECSGCDRLLPDGTEGPCECGGRRTRTSRRLLPAISGTLSAWSRADPYPAGDSAWLYLNDRRRAPALVHHLAVLEAVAGAPPEVGVTILPPTALDDLAPVLARFGSDAVRGALLRRTLREGSTASLEETARQEDRRIRGLFGICRDWLRLADPMTRSTAGQPIAGFLGELEAEDRAILARWERTRTAATAEYDRQAAGRAYRQLVQFLAADLEAYLNLVAPRLAAPAASASRRAALRTLHYLLRSFLVAIAPVVPHVAEVLAAALGGGRLSLFESGLEPPNAPLVSESAVAAWDRWRSVLRSVRTLRRELGLDPATRLPSLVAIAPSEELADALRGDRVVLERLAGVARFEAHGPASPWTGRRREMVPLAAQVQRAFPREASAILHVLRQMPPRRGSEPTPPDGIPIVLGGHTIQIRPEMFEFVERIPERFLPVAWPAGELYAELPAGRAVPARLPPPLSADAFQVVRTVQRALRRTPETAPPSRGPVVVGAMDPLATELRAQAPALAEYLGLPEFRVVEDAQRLPARPQLRGRTRTGAHWAAFLPGAPEPGDARRVAKSRRMRTRLRGLPSAALAAPPAVDYASPERVAEGDAIRALVSELDAILDTPLLGPAKVGVAWEVGFRSREAYAQAAPAAISALPGFGPAVAEHLQRRLGRLPPRPVADPSSGDAGAAGPTPAQLAAHSEGAPLPVPRDRPREAGPFPTVPVGSVPPPDPGPTGKAGREAEAPSPASPTPEAAAPGRASIPESGGGIPGSSTEPVPLSNGGAMDRETPPNRALASDPKEPPAPGPAEARAAAPAPGAPPSDLAPDLTFEMAAHTSAEGPTPIPVTPEIPDASAADAGVNPAAANDPGAAAEATGAPATSATGGEPDPTPPGSLATPTESPVSALPATASAPTDPPAHREDATTYDVLSLPVGPTGSGEPAVVDPSSAPPTLAASPRASPPAPVPASPISLSVAPTYVPALGEFLDVAAAGHRGICVVRESPERLRAHVGPRPVEIYWLTNLGRGLTVRPNDLAAYGAFLVKCLDEQVTAFFLEGLEYLARLHGAGRVVEVLLEFGGRARERGAKVWVYVHPELISPSDLAVFRGAFERGP